MSTYKDRLREAMQDAGMTVTKLAHIIGASYQGVKKVFDGNAPSGFNTINNQRAADALGVSADWLATGRGEKKARSDGAAGSNYIVDASGLSPTAIELAQLYDMLTDRISRAEAYAACSATILKILKSPGHQ